VSDSRTALVSLETTMKTSKSLHVCIHHMLATCRRTISLSRCAPMSSPLLDTSRLWLADYTLLMLLPNGKTF
jgi:hypothetical protein